MLSFAAVLVAEAALFRSPALHAQRSFCRPRAAARLLLDDSEFSMSSLQKELAKRSEEGGTKLEFAPGLGRFEKMRRDGPHHTTTPKEVVEYVVTKLQEGDIDAAFEFTCIPVSKRGCHKSSTVWTRRMAWDKARVIGGAPSGKAHERAEFDAMLRGEYVPLLQTSGYRFLGDASAWQRSNGMSETAVKEYVVEVKTTSGEHRLARFKLVYDWLLYCHLIATVQMFSLSSNAFPGAEDVDLDI